MIKICKERSSKKKKSSTRCADEKLTDNQNSVRLFWPPRCKETLCIMTISKGSRGKNRFFFFPCLEHNKTTEQQNKGGKNACDIPSDPRGQRLNGHRTTVIHETWKTLPETISVVFRSLQLWLWYKCDANKRPECVFVEWLKCHAACDSIFVLYIIFRCVCYWTHRQLYYQSGKLRKKTKQKNADRIFFSRTIRKVCISRGINSQ